MIRTLRTLHSWLRRRFPWIARAAGALRLRALRRRLRFLGKDRQEIFTEIYREQLWDASESASGSGSTLAATESIRAELPRLLARLGARSLLDAPCGDHYWMSRTELDLDHYIGGEIVVPLVELLNERYGDERRRFVHLDVVCDPLPEADAFLCRDCLLHLTNADVLQVLDNARRSSCTYLLASTYPDCASNAEIPTGLSRPLNLCLPPFNLPPPLELVADPGPRTADKCLGVWDLRPQRAGRGLD